MDVPQIPVAAVPNTAFQVRAVIGVSGNHQSQAETAASVVIGASLPGLFQTSSPNVYINTVYDGINTFDNKINTVDYSRTAIYLVP